MKWAYSIKQKITAATLLLVVLVLVLLNNLDQNRQFKKMVNSFSSLYEDRLVAESYIFKISEQLYQKDLTLEKPALPQEHKDMYRHVALQSGKAISHLIDQYRKTEFTMNERKYFDSLLSGIERLDRVEKAYIAADSYSANDLILKDTIKALVGINLQYLDALSDIQVNEGKKMTKVSKAALISNAASSQLETSFLIIIAIVIQILIFASNSMHGLLKQKPGLN